MGQKYWDGFHWVAKTDNKGKKDPSVMLQTQRMRKVQISNLPLYLGLTEQDVHCLVEKYLVDNFLAESNNNRPVLVVELHPEK